MGENNLRVHLWLDGLNLLVSSLQNVAFNKAFTNPLSFVADDVAMLVKQSGLMKYSKASEIHPKLQQGMLQSDYNANFSPFETG